MQVVEAWKRRRLDDQTDDLSLAWHVAAFSREKRLKPLRHYLERAKRVITGTRRTRPITPDDRRTVLEARDRWKRMLNAATQPTARRGRR